MDELAVVVVSEFRVIDFSDFFYWGGARLRELLLSIIPQFVVRILVVLWLR